MFKSYNDLCDVVSLMVYCRSDRSYLLFKEINGEFWLPSSKSENNCWKTTAKKIKLDVSAGKRSICQFIQKWNCWMQKDLCMPPYKPCLRMLRWFEHVERMADIYKHIHKANVIGPDVVACVPLRIYKIWLPNHNRQAIYHAIFKVSLKSEYKKRNKRLHPRLQWINSVELERLRVHFNLRSPEVAVFSQLVLDEEPNDLGNPMDSCEGFLTEISEDQVIMEEGAAGAAELDASHFQLLQAAKYTRDDQIRMYREFLLIVFPSLYMSPAQFTQFMVDMGLQKAQCPSLFRAADLTSRGGLSFLDLMLYAAALEPSTTHSGIAAEMRCKYIFRYYDGNSDSKLEYIELKDLIAVTRQMRQLPVDSLSVSRDADLILRQVGLQPNSQMTTTEFLRAVGEQRLRGTSSLLRAPRSIVGYLADLIERVPSISAINQNSLAPRAPAEAGGSRSSGGRAVSAERGRAAVSKLDYAVAAYTVRHNKKAPDLIELKQFAEEALSGSSARLLGAGSLEALSPAAAPAEALCAVRYFALACDKLPQRRRGTSSLGTSNTGKSAMTWASEPEEAGFGATLLRLAEAVRPLCAGEPRLLRLCAPVYVVGDLHGNLAALLAMESALWPSGPTLTPACLLFLGDYVDRGPHGAELLAYLFAAKLQRPRGILLVRGNHETRDIQKMFTFYNECVQKYGEGEGNKIWNAINIVFDVMPLAAVIDDKVFCCHGGIPPPWVCPLVSAIDKVPVPLPRPAEQSSIAWELLWNDPIKTTRMTATLALELAANEGFAGNARRGTGHVFAQPALDRFLQVNQLSLVVRAHEVHQAGFMCQLRGRLVSVFSSSHYCGGTNDSGVALLEGGKLRLIRVCIDN